MKTKIKLPKLLTIAWCKKNKKIVREMNEKYDKKFPSYWRRPSHKDYWKTRLAAHKLRDKKLGRTAVAWADEAKIEQIFRDCPPEKTIDHIFPVNGDLVSGLLHELNLQYLTLSENASKSNHFKPRYFITNRATITLD
jgi:hypothetical protein